MIFLAGRVLSRKAELHSYSLLGLLDKWVEFPIPYTF